MKLRPKTTRFIIEALEYRIKAYQDRLSSENLDEDEESDLTNDAEFLEAIRTELANSLKNDNLAKEQNILTKLTTKEKGEISLSLPDLSRQVLELAIGDRLLLVNAITDSIRQELAVSDPRAFSETESALKSAS
ncbi:MAG: hypothetical protein F6K47_20020 [Symploca sp. SIO2E6]|nr:hypothetical protein [Symploca sp. SIO2E6]